MVNRIRHVFYTLKQPKRYTHSVSSLSAVINVRTIARKQRKKNESVKLRGLSMAMFSILISTNVRRSYIIYTHIYLYVHRFLKLCNSTDFFFFSNICIIFTHISIHFSQSWNDIRTLAHSFLRTHFHRNRDFFAIVHSHTVVTFMFMFSIVHARFYYYFEFFRKYLFSFACLCVCLAFWYQWRQSRLLIYGYQNFIAFYTVLYYQRVNTITFTWMHVLVCVCKFAYMLLNEEGNAFCYVYCSTWRREKKSLHTISTWELKAYGTLKCVLHFNKMCCNEFSICWFWPGSAKTTLHT